MSTNSLRYIAYDIIIIMIGDLLKSMLRTVHQILTSENPFLNVCMEIR